MVSIRGAITINENTEEEILSKTKKLLKTIELRNNLDKNKVVSMVFSTTKDINKVAPSKAAREMGYKFAGLMNFNEMDVPGSLEKCIRVLIFYDVNKDQDSVKHIYLENARCLRPDL